MIAAIDSRRDDAQMIADAMARYTGEITQLEGFAEPKLIPRSNWIDPEAKLKRKKPIPPKETLSDKRLAALAELRKRKGIPVEYRTETHAQLAKKHGLSRSTIQRRLSMGFTMEQALQPPKTKGNKKCQNYTK